MQSISSEIDGLVGIESLRSDSIPKEWHHEQPPVAERNGVSGRPSIGDFTTAAEIADVLVTVFHPELTGGLAFHRYIARKCGLEPYSENQAPSLDASWDNSRWSRFARIAS